MKKQVSISKTSRRYKHLLWFLLASTPFCYLLFWLFVEKFAGRLGYYHAYMIPAGFSPVMKMLGFTVSMIQGVVVMYGLHSLAKLFSLYEKGQFFREENINCFKQLSNILLLWVGAGLLVTPLKALVLTMHNPPGHHMIELTFQSADLTALITGGILRVIAHVMDQGRELQEEVELTV